MFETKTCLCCLFARSSLLCRATVIKSSFYFVCTSDVWKPTPDTHHHNHLYDFRMFFLKVWFEHVKGKAHAVLKRRHRPYSQRIAFNMTYDLKQTFCCLQRALQANLQILNNTVLGHRRYCRLENVKYAPKEQLKLQLYRIYRLTHGSQQGSPTFEFLKKKFFLFFSIDFPQKISQY